MGATFGGSSQTVFGTDGPLPLLNKVTTAAAVIFMVTSITLAYISAHTSTSSIMQDISLQKPQESVIERAVEPLPETDMPLVPAMDVPMSVGSDAPAESASPVVDETVKPESAAPDQELIPAEQEKVEAVETVMDEVKETAEKAIDAVIPPGEEKAAH